MKYRPIAKWFRACLLIGAVFNFLGALSFAPPVYNRMANAFELPTGASPFSLWVIAAWIFIFGVGYAWLALNPQPERLFIAVAAACKIAIALFFFIFWWAGDLPLMSVVAGLGDLAFAIAFIVWLMQRG